MKTLFNIGEDVHFYHIDKKIYSGQITATPLKFNDESFQIDENTLFPVRNNQINHWVKLKYIGKTLQELQDKLSKDYV
jgi:hypothetical protein